MAVSAIPGLPYVQIGNIRKQVKMVLTDTVRKLLAKRGITTEEEIEEFLSESPKKTYDPFLMKNMDEGTDLILEEIKKGSKICIYGDYDADGITSTALLLSVFKYLTSPGQVDYYIPSRFEEGYGLNKEAIKNISDSGFNMIVTVDCGSVSYDEVEYAKQLGLKVLVTDHHNVTDIIADCLVINPKQPGCEYPFKSLAGCGVAFKMAQALQKKTGMPKSVLTEVLDLAAIGTVGDIMPLVDENRTIVKFGLKVIHLGKRNGLKTLLNAVSLKTEKVNSESISFVIVPHLNASGRIKDASVAVEVLRCDKAPKNDEARRLLDERVELLVSQNRQRKSLQQDTFQSCVKYLENEGCGSEETVKDFILIRSEDAHEGIAGIVAGKLKENYYRPSVLVTPSGEDNEYLKGTGRSIEGVNLYELLKKHESLFERFGGHAGACGFLMKSENLEILSQNLLNDMAAIKAEVPDIFERKYDIDLDVDVEDMTLELSRELDRMAPFGNANPKPLFMCSRITIEDVKFMGDREQHVRFSARSFNGKRMQCVLFNDAQKYGMSLFVRRPVDLIGTLECSVWQGVERLQFMVDEIKFD